MADKNSKAPKGEILQGSALAVRGSDTQGVMIGGVTFKAVRVVNVPTLKHETGQTVAFRINQPLMLKQNTSEETVQVDGQNVKASKTRDLWVARVTELTTMQEFEYVCNAITAGDIQDAYPSAGYVGRWFAIQKGATVAGKRYKEVKIIEIQPDGAQGDDGFIS